MTLWVALRSGWKKDCQFGKDERQAAIEYAKTRRSEGFFARTVKVPSERVISRGRGMKWSGGGWAVIIKK